MLVNKGQDTLSSASQSVSGAICFTFSYQISGDGEVLWHFIFMIVYSYTEDYSLNWEGGHQTGMGVGLEGTRKLKAIFLQAWGKHPEYSTTEN